MSGAPGHPVAWPCSRRSADQSRNGPPDAVSSRRATDAIRSPASDCHSAECSESMGRTQASGLAIGSPGSMPAALRGQLARQRHHQVATRHERLLVGRRDHLARPKCGQDRPQAHDAARRHDDHVHVVPGREPFQRVGLAVERHAGGRHRCGLRAPASARAATTGRHADQLGGERLDVASRGDGDDPELVRTCAGSTSRV